MITFVAFHGWAFSASFWQPLKRALEGRAEFHCVDLGFTAPASLPLLPNGPSIALGHSLGFMYALRERPAFSGYVSINGFPRFCRTENFPDGIMAHAVRHMRHLLHDTPSQVRDDFLVRCGADPAEFATDTLNTARLAEGLEWLQQWDERRHLPDARHLLALTGARDRIVPPAMSRALFPAPCLIECPEGGHLMPHTHAEWCARRILAFAEKIL